MTVTTSTLPFLNYVCRAVAGLRARRRGAEGTLTIAMHFTPVARWFDPSGGENMITPFFFLYPLHDALLKPMPGVGSALSLA